MSASGYSTVQHQVHTSLPLLNSSSQERGKTQDTPASHKLLDQEDVSTGSSEAEEMWGTGGPLQDTQKLEVSCLYIQNAKLSHIMVTPVEKLRFVAQVLGRVFAFTAPEAQLFGLCCVFPNFACKIDRSIT